MRIWFKIFKDNHLQRDMVVTDDSEDTRTHKVFAALEQVCYEFDLSKPIWLDATVSEFKRHGIFDRETADSFRNNILSRGGTETPAELYRRFRGQDPTIDALLIRDGIISEQTPSIAPVCKD